ncbi:AmpG family muropeptide MFS transporter [Anaerobiospirillum thomasii]|uniref:Muropeptide transporter n=1 Tax=Anaerobiospirillum thomasii TaxID=179995 RepID=A0A2X0WSN7_9GAMM|nr:AmpG family muropeptide MFS transporter [Anaerobiospirillum thomasii]SPT69572.1 muropeptide transporter [Anaerobiospirillum thomasii]
MSEACTADTAVKTSVLRQIFSKKMAICIITGFGSGMPLFVLLNLLSAYLAKEGLDLKVIGAMSLIMFPYTWKFLWAPFVDRYTLFKGGRRKSWMLVTALLLTIAIGLMGLTPPKESIAFISLIAFFVAFISATQDIVLDAYRREILTDNELGLGNSIFVNSYKVSSLVPGGLSLILADFIAWDMVFFITALFMLPNVLLALFIKEPQVSVKQRSLKEAVVDPFREFIQRRGIKAALICVLFVFLYKLGDSMAVALATPFYIDLDYDLTTIGIVVKNVGLWSTVIGGLAGGVIMLKIGINRALWLFGLVQLVTILGFVLLAYMGRYGTPSILILSAVVCAEFLGAGLGTAAFVSYIARETNPLYTATQIALLTSLSAVPRTFCNATTGFLVEALGWERFFMLCTVLAIPGMLLLFYVAPFNQKDESVAGA